MHNTLVIAKKEFSDLIRSNVVIIVMAVYLMSLLYSYYVSYNSINNTLLQFGVASFSKNPAISPGALINVLCGYGGLVAVVLGLSSMYHEVHNKALNTLVNKPVYRDTILNGKLLGAILFAFCLFIFTTLIDISLNFIFWGEHFNKIFSIFIGELPLVLVVYMLVFLMFYLLTVLMFLLFHRSSLAFFLAFILWIFIYDVLPSGFASCLASFFPNSDQTVWFFSCLSPNMMIFLIYAGATDTIGAISANAYEFLKLVLYIVVLLVSCYTVFLRRDIS